MAAPLLSVLQQLFPALNGTLSLGLFILQGEGDDDEQAVAHGQQGYAAVRAANQRAQDGSIGGNAVWTQLHRVVCDALFFSLLRLRCPVRLAMLSVTVGYAVALAQAARCVMDALRANPLPHLKLSLVLNGGLGMFNALFSPELGARLTHLTFCLLYIHESMWRDMFRHGI